MYPKVLYHFFLHSQEAAFKFKIKKNSNRFIFYQAVGSFWDHSVSLRLMFSGIYNSKPLKNIVKLLDFSHLKPLTSSIGKY